MKSNAPASAPGIYLQHAEQNRTLTFFLKPLASKDAFMNNVPLQPIIAILAGVLILLRPALLNYVVALYLIIIGVLGIIGPRRL